MTRDSDTPVSKTPRKPRGTSSRSKEKDRAQDGTVFLGVRLPKEVHQRLYRAKASLEFETGHFYGMGRLLERIILSGLDCLEREEGTETREHPKDDHDDHDEHAEKANG